jgi:hypothetical protein
MGLDFFYLLSFSLKMVDALVVKLVDTQDLKSCLQQCKCGFKSRLGHTEKGYKFVFFFFYQKFLKHNAEVAQLVEHNLAKVGVARSNRVFCSHKNRTLFECGFFIGSNIGRTNWLFLMPL